jgi:hypothetical protein
MYRADNFIGIEVMIKNEYGRRISWHIVSLWKTQRDDPTWTRAATHAYAPGHIVAKLSPTFSPYQLRQRAIRDHFLRASINGFY